MNRFTPSMLLAGVIAWEFLSRISLLFLFMEVPSMAVMSFNKGLDARDLLYPAIYALVFAVAHWRSQNVSLQLGGAAKANLRAFLQNKFLNMPPIQERSASGEMPLQELPLHYMKAVYSMEPWFSKFLPQAFLAATFPLFVLVVVFFTDKTVCLILLLTGMIMPLFLFLIGKAAQKKSETQWKSFARLRAFFLESLQGMKTIKIFKAVREREKQLELAEEEFKQKTMGVLKIAFISALVQEWVASLSIALIAVSLGLRLLNGTMSFELSFAALLFATEFYRPLRQLGTTFHASIEAKTAWNSIKES